MPYKKFYRNKTILITGGAGAIGRNLTEALSAEKENKIIVLDNLTSSYQWNIPDKKNILFIKGDLRNNDDLKRVFHHKPTIVFHLAAFFANQNSVDYPLISEDVNCNGVLNLLEHCILAGNIERFIYTNSEGGAYGENSEIPYRENDISFNLSSPYYISKMAGEAYCMYYYSFYKLPVSVVRLFNSYGPGEIPGQYRNAIPNFIYWALKKQPLPLTGNKKMSRDFVFVKDTVEGILRAGFFEDAIGNSVNIATGKECIIFELADLINRKTSNEGGVVFLNKRKWDSRESIIGSTDKCMKILKFIPSTHIETGIDLTIQWFRENWERIDKSSEFPPGLNPSLDV